MNNMRETLINQLTKEEFQLIVELGKGNIQLPRYFFLSETEKFEPIPIIRFLHILIMELNGMVIIL